MPIRPDVIGYAGGRYVLHLAPQAAGQPARVLVYRDRPPAEGGPVWSFDSPITPSGEKGDKGRAVETWSPSTSLTWGILGRTLVDFSAETATDLGPWRTTHVLSDRAYGRVGDQTAVAGPAIPATVVDAAAGVPDDLTTAGALIRTHSEDGIEREYLLPEVQQ